jgi:hypothetical protein
VVRINDSIKKIPFGIFREGKISYLVDIVCKIVFEGLLFLD